MTPDRYQRITELFQAAAARDPKARSAFLAESCAGDDDLRREVEAMLAVDAQAGGFLDELPGDIAADLLEDASGTRAGTVLGPYRIIESRDCSAREEWLECSRRSIPGWAAK